MKKMITLFAVLGMVLALAPAAIATITPVTTITTNGPNIDVLTLVAGGVTYTTSTDLVTGTSVETGGAGTIDPIGNQDNFELANRYSRGGDDAKNETWTVSLFGGVNWSNSNGGDADFFIFERGGGDSLRARPIFVGLGVGQYTVLNTSGGTINYGDTGLDDGDQNITALAFGYDDLVDGDGAALTNQVLIGLDFDGYNSDIYSISAVKVVEAPLTPEIDITGNGNSITNGDITPILGDHTDFGSTITNGLAITNTYTVKNTGQGDLTLTNATVTGGGRFVVTSASLDGTVLTFGQTTNFVVTYTPNAVVGTHTQTVSVVSGDTNANPYTFYIKAETKVPGPEIDITGDGNSITNGDATPSLTDHTDFGSTITNGLAIVRTYTVTNSGTANLTLTEPTLSGDTEFVASALSSTNLTPGGAAATFTVTYTPSATPTVHTNTVRLANNDSDENPYDFAITAETTAAPEPEIAVPEIDITGNSVSIPDGNSATSLADHTDFGSTPPNGDDIVRTYTVTNSGTADLTLDSDATITGDSRFTVSSATLLNVVLTPGQTTNFEVTYTPDATKAVHTATVSLDNNDGDEDPYTFAIQAETQEHTTSVVPFGHAGGYRIAFITDGSYVADQTDITIYDGYVEAEAQATSGQAIDLSGVSGWKVIGATAGMNARAQTDTIGSGGANDVPIYDVNGIMIALGNENFWGTTPASYLESNADSLLTPMNYKPDGTKNGGDRVFTGMWSDGTPHATAALGQTTVVDGDQRQVGSAWADRGGHVLPNVHNGSGLPLYAISPVITAVAPGVPTILINGSDTLILPGDTTPSTGDDTDFGSVNMGSADITKTYTVSNFGTAGAALELSAPIISGSGAFAVTTGLGSTSLAAGETTTFTVTYTVNSGARSIDDAKVSVASDATDNDPYEFDITATTLHVGVITTPGDGYEGVYRIAFVTLGKRGATSTDIADYNDFVTTEAGLIPELDALGVEWKCIGSTETVSAKTNTSTHTTGDANDVPIYTTTGQLIATNNADLWDGFILAGINFGDGSLTSETGCWTGTKWDGEPDDYTGDPSGPLGTGFGGSNTGANANISIGNASRINNGWIKAGNTHDGEIDGGSTAEKYFMALSGLLGLPPAGTVIIIR